MSFRLEMHYVLNIYLFQVFRMNFMFAVEIWIPNKQSILDSIDLKVNKRPKKGIV